MFKKSKAIVSMIMVFRSCSQQDVILQRDRVVRQDKMVAVQKAITK